MLRPRRTPRLGFLLAGAFFSIAGPALADAPQAAPAEPNGVLLAPLRSSADVRAQAATFNALLAQELGKLPELKLSTAQSIGSMSPADQRVLKRGDPAAATLAAQAGSRFLLGGRLSTIGDLALLQLFLIDARNGKTIARQSARQRGSTESLRGAVPALVASLAAHTKPFPTDAPPSISQVVDYNQGFLNSCYEEQLVTNPHLAGRVVLRFRLTADQQIDEVSVDDGASALKSDPLFRCIESSSRQWRIPHLAIAGAAKAGEVESAFNFTPVLGAPGQPVAANQMERKLLPRSAAAESTLKASHSKARASIRFENHTANPVQIYWLDFQGKRKRYPDLPANKDRVLQTFLGHPWVAADETGKTLEIFVPASPSTVAVIEGSLKARDPSQESKLKSQTSRIPASIRFVNRTPGAVQLYWLDYDGKRTQRDQIGSLQEKSLPTFTTHPWLVADAKGKTLGIYLAKEGGESTAIIEPSP